MIAVETNFADNTELSVKAVIFDMDGLLIDSEKLWDEVDARVLSHYGKYYYPELKYKFMGCEALDSARRFCSAYHLNVEPQIIAEMRSVVAEELYAQKVTFMPGALEVVKLYAARGVKLALATCASRRLLSVVENRLPELFLHFKAKVCADDVQRGKPAPDLFLLAAEKLNVEPNTCIVFEDSPNGVAAARAAGMQVIAVPNPSFTSFKLFKDAHFIVSSLVGLVFSDACGLVEQQEIAYAKSVAK